MTREVGTCSHSWSRIEGESEVDLDILPGVIENCCIYVTASMSCVVAILVNISFIFVIEKKGYVYSCKLSYSA